MRIDEAFPSKYLKAADLQGRNATVTISHCDVESIGNERKLILYFQGKQKGMVLNKTNANNIGDLYGQDTDDWSGREIVLVEAMVDYQGKSVPAIRVRAPRPNESKQPARRADPISSGPQRREPEMTGDENGDRLNDDIPF